MYSQWNGNAAVCDFLTSFPPTHSFLTKVNNKKTTKLNGKIDQKNLRVIYKTFHLNTTKNPHFSQYPMEIL